MFGARKRELCLALAEACYTRAAQVRTEIGRYRESGSTDDASRVVDLDWIVFEYDSLRDSYARLSRSRFIVLFQSARRLKKELDLENGLIEQVNETRYRERDRSI